MEENQNKIFSKFLNITDWIFSNALDVNDKISLYEAQKLLKFSPFVYDNVTAYFSEKNAANSLFIAVNLAQVVYQYLFASWFMYLTTSVSGIKKLYKVIFQNPILGIFFYFSFYYRMIGETDKNKFNKIAEFFNLPKHEDLGSKKFIEKFTNEVSKKLTDTISVNEYEVTAKELIHKVFSENAIAASIESSPIKIYNILEYLLKEKENNKILMDIEYAAVYIDKRTVETQRDLDEFSDFVTTNRDSIEKQIKKEIGSRKGGKKRIANLRLEQIVEKKTDEGEPLCLDKCKSRVKTVSGCYCEGDCGSTTFLGGKSWCYVDPNKCKRKYLNKYLGRTYDFCDNKKLSSPKCFTGLKYKNCVVK
jgi:hypothetical protein